MFGASPSVAPFLSLAFGAPVALEDGLSDRLAVRRRIAPVKNMRGVVKAEMAANEARPTIEVDPRTFAVHIDGVLVTEDPVSSLSLAQALLAVLSA